MAPRFARQSTAAIRIPGHVLTSIEMVGTKLSTVQLNLNSCSVGLALLSVEMALRSAQLHTVAFQPRLAMMNMEMEQINRLLVMHCL